MKTKRGSLQETQGGSLDLAAAFRTSFEFGFGSGAGIRTLNLAVNRPLRPVRMWRSEFAQCH